MTYSRESFYGLFLAGFLLSAGASEALAQRTPAPPTFAERIKHVIIVFQENRSTDNLFHGLPHADIADRGLDSSGKVIRLTPIHLAGDYDMKHDHASFLAMYDGGKMDGANLIPVTCRIRADDCPPPNAAFTYVYRSEVAPYLDMAQQYTFADRMFQTNQGPSFPAHQYIIAGTSAPTATSDLLAENNAKGIANAGSDTGCTAPAEETVEMIDPTGDDSFTQFPCFEHPTLIDLLDEKGITWKYYTSGTNSLWTGPNAISHLRFGPDWDNVIPQPGHVLTDIAAGALPQVSWVIPTGPESDHALSNDGSGPSWVASIVNAVGNSPYWSDTAIIVTWDDWGGWYDHVRPTIRSSYEYGFRVPLIVISPYAKPGYVSHVDHNFGSILKFVEKRFGLPSLGYADARSDDLADCFDYKQTPLTFHTIEAPLKAEYFLNDKRPPTDPDDE